MWLKWGGGGAALLLAAAAVVVLVQGLPGQVCGDEAYDACQEAAVEPEHEEADVLDEEGDEAEEDAGRDGDDCVGPHREDVLLQTDEVDDDRAENEPGQKHDCLEAPANSITISL